jgi:glucose/arabinose dehydrogenase
MVLPVVGQVLFAGCGDRSEPGAPATSTGVETSSSSATTAPLSSSNPNGSSSSSSPTSTSTTGTTTADTTEASPEVSSDAPAPSASDSTPPVESTTPSDSSVPDTSSDVIAAPCDASTRPTIGGLGLQTLYTGDGLTSLSYAVQPPGSEDWYLVEQKGTIRILREGALLDAPFFDVSDEVVMPGQGGYEEQGLHSIAFPPDYATSGKFYVLMTPNTGDRTHRDLLLEYQRSAANPDIADPAPVREFFALEGRDSTGLFDNLHNAYQAKFGPDGMLYVGMGDGGGECNNNQGFQDLPQDVNSPMGKILRFDVSKNEAPYGADDNPFVAAGDARVYHYGVRNPFRFSWDKATGDFYFGDVGQDTHEEINVALSGQIGLNFGWANYEGKEQTCTGRMLNTGATAVPPIFDTSHGGGSGLAPACLTSPFCDYSSIVGGVVYRGSALPDLRGVYIFGDWAGNNMAALYHCDGATSEITEIDYEADPNLPNNGYLVKADEDAPGIRNITSIVEGNDGEIYMTVNANTLLKIVAPPSE